MILEGRLDQMLTDALPHEITHTILADWYRQPVPRWADEGAALLSESAPSRAKQEAAMTRVLKAKRVIPLRKLLPALDYPRDVMAFYGQALSLTDFLVGRSGRQTFLAFVADGQRGGWDEAARAHYNFRTVEDLERAWLDRVAPNSADVRPEAKAARTPPANVPVSTPGADGVKRRPDEGLQQGIRLRAGDTGGLLPAGPGPSQALVSLEGSGRLLVRRANHYYEPRTALNSNGQPVTTYHLAAVLDENRYRFKDVRVYDTSGKRIDRKALVKLLPKETLALISFSGDLAMDPLYLRLIKEGTLLFVLPAPVGPPAVATPAPQVVPAAPVIPPVAGPPPPPEH
jgi:hypothetical protein